MTNRKASISVLFLLFYMFPFEANGMDGEQRREMLMVTGEQKVLDATEVASFSESTSGIIEVKIPRNGRQLVLTAIRPGSTSLLLIRHDGTQKTIYITVFARKPETIIEEISRLVGKNSRIEYRRLGPRIFVDGTVGTAQDQERVESIAKLYSGQVQSLVRVGPTVQKRTNIRIDLTFVELNSSDSLEGGVKWPKDAGASGTLDFSLEFNGSMPSGSYSVVDQAMPALRAAQSRGHAKIKKKAYLITTSGNEATYTSGGEVNIPIAGSQAAELRTIGYGCTLEVMPILDIESGLIDLEIEAEVSELKETSHDAPGRTVSRVRTLVHLGLGQSVVLSGLDSHTESRTKSGVPFLSRIPIVGMLFGVHRKRTSKVNGIVAITPVVLDNVDSKSRKMIDDALKRFKNYKGKL